MGGGEGCGTPHLGRPHPGRLAGRPYWGSEQGGGRRRGGYAPRSGAPALPGMDSRLGASATCLRRNDGENGRGGKGWKVPDSCAGRRRRPVPMGVVRHSGCSTSAPALRQPRASERMWRRREIISVWGSLDHQKCPTIRRYGGVDSLPSLCGMASPKATTVESGEGELRSATRRGGGSGD